MEGDLGDGGSRAAEGKDLEVRKRERLEGPEGDAREGKGRAD